MQPYFLPYIGYFQLIKAVDYFVVYDDVKYTKKGWINRNRILRGGEAKTFTLPLEKASDHLDVCERRLSSSFNREKLSNQFRESYRKAPYFEQVFPLIEKCIHFGEEGLFDFIHHSILEVCKYLEISTPIRVSSSLEIDPSIEGTERIYALCQHFAVDTYVNAIGGTQLYVKEEFQKKGLALKFLQSELQEYPQLGCPHVPWLSIVDVMMFNSKELITERFLKSFRLV